MSALDSGLLRLLARAADGMRAPQPVGDRARASLADIPLKDAGAAIAAAAAAGDIGKALASTDTHLSAQAAAWSPALQALSALPLPATSARAASIALAGTLLDTAALRALLAADPAAASPGGLVAARLRDGLEHSGLFYEAHQAQWVQGERSDAALRLEIARIGPALPGASAPAPAALGERVLAQLDVLHQQRVQMNLEVWTGQTATLQIACTDAGARWQAAGTPLHDPALPMPLADAAAGSALGRALPRPQDPEGHARDDDPEHAAAGATARPAGGVATLVLDLPNLGRLTARVRVSGNTVALEVSHAQPARITAHLAECGAQFAARGLIPVVLHAAAPDSRQRGGAFTPRRG